MTPAATSNLNPAFEFPPIVRALGVLMLGYVCFLAMEAVHELGHMMNAWSVGANVVEVRFPLFGISQTIVDPDPDPRLVAWGGPTLGVAIPVFACALARLIRRRVPEPLKFFAGFCLIANGVYMT